MNYFRIDKDDINNGDGFRVILWVAGCNHKCEGCQNPETWNPENGKLFDDDALNLIINYLQEYHIEGITFSGGDPLYPFNIKCIANIIKKIRDTFKDEKNIWLYTGYKYENLISVKDNSDLNYILNNINVMVDDEFKKDLHDSSLKWRGSSNQSVIDVKRSHKENKKVLYCN